MAKPGFLLVEEVAALCRASTETVRHWLKTGRLASIRPARRRLIAQAEVERFLKSKASDTAAPKANVRSGEGDKP